MTPGKDAREQHLFLTPLLGKPRRKSFCTWDLESKDGPSDEPGFTRVFLAGLYDGSSYQGFFGQYETESSALEDDWRYRAFMPGGATDRFMRSALTDKYRGHSFYAHNGGAFDFLHILPWLVRYKVQFGLQVSLVPLGNSGLLAIDVWKTKNKWQRWRFVDSIRLLPMSLEVAARAFGAGRKMRGADGSELLDRHGKPFSLKTPEDDPGWLAYNESDCRLLYDVLVKVHDLVETHFGGEIGLTAPSTAIKTFRRSFLKKAVARDVDTHEFVRRGYFGGRTEVFGELGHYLHYFDVNSSYPKQMTLDMPAGGAQWWQGEPPGHWQRTRIGFCEVVVRVPEMAIPPLPVRADARYFPDDEGVEGKLVFPTGVLTGVWEWGELDNAILCGAEILEWKQSVWYDAVPLLREFVETLYTYRDQAHCFECHGDLEAEFHCPQCNKPGYDAGLAEFAKLLANSTYGKFAQNTKRIKFYWVTDPDMPKGATPIVPDDPECQVWIKEEEGDAPFIMPQISTRITAQARVLLHRAAMEAESRWLRQCLRCHSKVTFTEHRRADVCGRGPQLAKATNVRPSEAHDQGGSGPHGDVSRQARIGWHSLSCPCGGALETRRGKVYYMDTDSILTDVILPTGSALGELKDEIPRYSGYVNGRFYGPKLYRLGVDAAYAEAPEELRRAMLERDPKYLTELRKDKQTGDEDFIDDANKAKEWQRIKAKGIGKKARTAANLDMLYEGALERLRWYADPQNRRPDGRYREMPKAIETAGTLVEQRLEKVGTLARLVKRDKKGRIIKRRAQDGRLHSISAAFERGPMERAVPKRLHLEGAKRRHHGDGTTSAYRIDMRKGA